LFKGLLSLKSKKSCSGGNSFSIVIAARNEEKVIARCLDSILNQTIHSDRFEVVVVNDRSDDTTLSIVKNYESRFTNIRSITIENCPEGVSPKKYAVSQGIAITRNDIIVFTDADCVVKNTWLETIDQTFEENTGLVQGITSYEYIPKMNRLFFGLQAVDFLSHGVVAAAAIGSGVPINSNANNFAFRRDVFTEIDGFGKIASSVVSGDDDLLLQRIWKSGKWNIRYMLQQGGIVATLPTMSIKGVFEQRKRWGSKTVHYNQQQVIILSGIFLFYITLFINVLAGFWAIIFFKTGMLMLLVKIMGELILMIPGTGMFNQKKLRKYIVPASILQLPMVLAAVMFGVFGKFKWKNQDFSRRLKSTR
jgi:cellulose synthase/poly-beta-1,6-N-acetylglucosamine synthase-like glycosyltransferase